MSTDLIVRSLEGAAVQQRRADGFVNATALCQAAGKEWFGFVRTLEAREFIAELQRSPQICGDPVVQTISTGPNELRGTWVHPKLAIRVAQWCSPRFAVLVTDWVFDLLTTGRVDFGPPADIAPYTRRVLAAAQVELLVPDGHWCVFIEAAPVLLRAEQVLVPAGLLMDADDLLDGSVGIFYGKYRKGQPWAGQSTRYTYRFPAPSKRAGIEVTPHAYPNCELVPFREWLRSVYLPQHFPAYIAAKYGDTGWLMAMPHIRRVMPNVLGPGGGEPPSRAA